MPNTKPPRKKPTRKIRRSDIVTEQQVHLESLDGEVTVKLFSPRERFECSTELSPLETSDGEVLPSELDYDKCQTMIDIAKRYLTTAVFDDQGNQLFSSPDDELWHAITMPKDYNTMLTAGMLAATKINGVQRKKK